MNCDFNGGSLTSIFQYYYGFFSRPNFLALVFNYPGQKLNQ